MQIEDSMKPLRPNEPVGLALSSALLLATAGLVLPALPEAFGMEPFVAALRWTLPALSIAAIALAWFFFARRDERLAALAATLRDALPAVDRPAEDALPLANVEANGKALAARLSALATQTGGQSSREHLQTYKRERVEAILEVLPDAVLFLDDEGVAAVCNDKIGLLAGLDPAQVVGRGFEAWASSEPVRQAVGELLSSLQNGLSGQTQFSDDQDRRIAVFGRTVFARRMPERRLGALLAFRDVTDEWLAHKGRDEFIAHVAHELKTPLGNVTTYGEELRGMVDPTNAFAVECANTVCDEADRMTRLINNLLDISRIEAGTMGLDLQRVRLHDLFEDCMENVAYAAKAKNIATHARIPPDMAPVYMDKSLIRVAISNLLNNAVKYNRPGGEIELIAEETPDGVTLSVQDTGIGIPADDIPHLFEKHYRAKDAEAEERGGHGLGLYLVKRIVDLHRGKIEVASQHGVGSRFQIQLPASTVLL